MMIMCLHSSLYAIPFNKKRVERKRDVLERDAAVSTQPESRQDLGTKKNGGKQKPKMFHVLILKLINAFKLQNLKLISYESNLSKSIVCIGFG